MLKVSLKSRKPIRHISKSDLPDGHLKERLVCNIFEPFGLIFQSLAIVHMKGFVIVLGEQVTNLVEFCTHFRLF